MTARHAPPGRNLAIKESTSVADTPCILCSRPTHPFAGPELFLADTWDLVCWECGAEHAPELTDMLAIFWEVTMDMIDEEDASRITASA